MKLSVLLKTLEPLRIQGASDIGIGSLTCDSRQVEPGDVFFALPGTAADGHRFLAQACERGAAALVVEREENLPDGVPVVVVANARRALARAAATFYGDPSAAMLVIGVTGTNGKTTVTYLLESILRAAGRRPAVVGTINYRFGGQSRPASHTTPDPLELLRTIAGFRAAGADALVMEVSSHALSQYRVDGIHFDAGIFTNLTPEHLDFHGDMESYFAGKRRFFSDLLREEKGQGVINLDDPFGKRLATDFHGVLTCAISATAAVRPLELTVDFRGIRGRLATPVGELPLESTLLGPFNAQNLVCAAAGGIALGLDVEDIARGLRDCPPVPGRFERIPNALDALALVDYAHTGDALEQVLCAARSLNPKRVITVFGCGGDRDRGKRPVMGEVAARLSDLVIMTSDNPRGEDPQSILDEIRPGVWRIHPGELSREAARRGERGALTILDRREAIGFGVSLLEPGDLLLVAGKGHEDYQIIGDQRLHFDDREEVRKALTRKEAGG